jgi:thiamine biosynthesis lipoprotein
MGTTVSVVLPARQAAEADRVVALFEAWEGALSRFRPDSELSRLNAAAGRPFAASPLLLEVVASSLRAARASDGIFDPSLEPALRALGYDRTFEDVALDGPAVGRAPAGGSWRSIDLDRAAGTIRLPRECALDLGGIAKGMAVDAAVSLLAERGVAAAIVEAGGDIAVTGLPPGAGAWPVAVEVGRGLREVGIASGALATSGISRRRWRRGGVEQHHLLDPRDGAPARNDLWSVTAAAVTCAQAEVAAKVAYVLGRERGMRFLLRVGIPALLVRRDGSEVLVGSWREGGAPGPAITSSAAGFAIAAPASPAQAPRPAVGGRA